MDLELAQLQTPAPAPLGPSQDELLEAERQRLAREEEARRLAELEQRRAAELAFQQARILLQQSRLAAVQVVTTAN